MSDQQPRRRSVRLNPEVFEEGLQQEQQIPAEGSSSGIDTNENPHEDKQSIEVTDQGSVSQGSEESTEGGEASDTQEGWSFNEADEDSNENSTDTSLTTIMSSPITTPTEVVINGEKIYLVSQPNQVAELPRAVHTKQDRMKLPPKEKLEVIKQILLPIFTKSECFDLTRMNYSSEEALEETSAIGFKVEKLVAHLEKFDMTDVFTVMEFSNYMTISPVKVAASNEWYLLYTDVNQQPWTPENLKLTKEIILNCVMDELRERIVRELDKYPETQQGGPLVYSVMMMEIQRNNDLCLKNLME